MKSFSKLTGILILATGLSGCLGSDGDGGQSFTSPEPPQSGAQLRIVHASPDAPTVSVQANGNAIGAFQGLDYQQATGFRELAAASYDFAVDADLPGGSAATVLDLNATSLISDTQYSVIAVGDTANLEALVIANPEAAVGDGNARAQIVHAAPDAPTVDVYVTAVNAPLANEQAIATLEFKGSTGQVEVPSGDYQVRITPAGTTTVVFDSGPISLPAGADLLILATQNVGPGGSPVSLLVADGAGSSLVIDANTPAAVRAIHGVADAPAVDVIADLEGMDDLVLFNGAQFKGVTDYLEVQAGDYLIDIAADADNSILPIDDAPLSVMAGVRYTAIANGTLATIDLDVVVDDVRSLATAAQVRIFHASPSTPAVDIYVTADGDIANVSPAFEGVEYNTETLAETGYVQLAAGDYVVTVTPTGTKTAAIETPILSLAAGGIYSALAVDGDMPGDAPQLILADDFIN